MATYKTRAVVLSRHNLGEADRIVTVLTPDRGKLRAVAKGVRRPLSRQAGHIELFSEVDLMLAEGKNLDIITSARLRHYPANLASDYDRLRLAWLMIRMAERLSGDHPSGDGLYHLLVYSLKQLNEQPASASLELFYKLKLLAQLGYQLQLDHCSVCAGKLAPPFASPRHGGMVCHEHRDYEDVELSANQLGLWRRIQGSDLNALVASDETLALETLDQCDTFYEYIFGRRFLLAV